ncbi:IS701 family transposase [Streptomyces cyaneofuscatus]|uniref:IS701 family transposase n=1 Tax=Streptomyces cyaneofuscatus TaxID=66883 RepID=UPI0036DC571A
MSLSLVEPRCRDVGCEFADRALLAEVGAQLFGSLQRGGQRRKAERYVRGLLSSTGRKTLRNIATHFEGGAAQQSVHHFISESPWEWMPVRHALARYTHRRLDPEAWVVRPTVIPKGGAHSIGVDAHYLPHLRQSVNGQQAVGAWMASHHHAVPVDWRLRLTGRWLSGPLRERAGIPAHIGGDTLEEVLCSGVSAMVAAAGELRRPVVVDAESVDAVALAGHLARAGLPYVVRVGPQQQLRLDRGELPRYGAGERTAGELVTSLTRLRRRTHTAGGPATVVAIPVVAPHAAPHPRAMTLIGQWPHRAPERQDLWLTGGGALSLSRALRLARLSDVVARDFAAVSDDVGVRDFTGRSFPGWHRHTTLASVAHLVATLVPHARGTAAQTLCPA